MQEYLSIAMRTLGKPLPVGAIVHHANEDRLDNEPGNLVICPNRSYHALLHARMRALKDCGNPNFRKCFFCKRYDDPKHLVTRANKLGHTQCHDEARRLRAETSQANKQAANAPVLFNLPAEKTLSIKETAQLLNRVPSAIRESLKAGKLQGKKVLGRWEVYQASVERALNGEPPRPSTMTGAPAPALAASQE